MISFKEFLREFKLLKGFVNVYGQPYEMFMNPTKQRLLTLLNRYGQLRGTAYKDNVYLAPANKVLHHDIFKALEDEIIFDDIPYKDVVDIYVMKTGDELIDAQEWEEALYPFGELTIGIHSKRTKAQAMSNKAFARMVR